MHCCIASPSHTLARHGATDHHGRHATFFLDSDGMDACPDNMEYDRWLVVVGSETRKALFRSEAVVERPVCMLVYDPLLYHGHDTWLTHGLCRPVRVLVHNSHLPSTLRMVHVIYKEVWAGREGLLVVDGNCVIKLWVAHKAGSLVFCSVAWDQGRQHIVTLSTSDLAIRLHKDGVTVLVVE
ncbi:hypothetical protein GUJ93_ZPchr0012g20660 [Zizania palustris]|uniref:Uncharacterized protein n=1 Tax=Zizania palustris TaxID=103762 RepID=A0A8J5WXN5_ZIZPA|nr:hypothetical protein GUJ93_ZPchr0012g20660 [Zizania palustris]